MVVLIIIAILLVIAIPIYADVAETAEIAVMRYNGTYVVKVLALNIFDFENEDRYDAPTAGDFNYSEDSMNNLLEKELEDYQANSNRDSIKNVKSRSLKILHGDNPVGGSIADGRNPAVFITGNAAYSYTGGGSMDNLIGSIVAYFNQAAPYNVQVYYIDRDGVRGELLVNLD